MKIFIIGFFLCLFGARVLSKPQITRLFPVEELPDYHQQTRNEVKPPNNFLEKLRATYNFVFRKPENTTNVEKISAKDAPNPDIQALKSIWLNQARRRSENKTDLQNSYVYSFGNDKTLSITKTDNEWIDDVQPLQHIEPLGSLELQDETENKDQEVEIINTGTNLQFPITLSRHLVEWLGSLLGLTFGVYTKLARAIHGNATVKGN